MTDAPVKNKRRVRLIADEEEEKVWAATAIVSEYTEWVTIDAIAVFLRLREMEHRGVSDDEANASSRYALATRALKWKHGWEDALIAGALSRAVDHDLVDYKRDEGTNLFRAKKEEDHALWALLNYETPTDPAWSE